MTRYNSKYSPPNRYSWTSRQTSSVNAVSTKQSWKGARGWRTESTVASISWFKTSWNRRRMPSWFASFARTLIRWRWFRSSSGVSWNSIMRICFKAVGDSSKWEMHFMSMLLIGNFTFQRLKKSRSNVTTVLNLNSEGSGPTRPPWSWSRIKRR